MAELRLRRCFRPELDAGLSCPDDSGLTAEAAEGLGMLLPLLGCGEEAAVLAFDGLARAAPGTVAGRALAAIARDEEQHDAVISRLRQIVPRHPDEAALLRRARRFHITLGAGGTALHLARIAALDAAVCTVLSRLLRPAAPLARAPGVARALAAIRDDEARHVAVSRRIALFDSNRWALRDGAAAARTALADVLGLAADGFEQLGVDPTRLDRDVRRLPDGLLRA
jgi:hypothetical protein